MTLEQLNLIEEKYINALLKKMDREDVDTSTLHEDVRILNHFVVIEGRIREGTKTSQPE